MTKRNDDVLFDTWAWMEILLGTPTGAKLRERYLHDPKRKVFSADVSLAELAGKLARQGQLDKVEAALDAIVADSAQVLPITQEDAKEAAPILLELRKTHERAG